MSQTQRAQFPGFGIRLSGACLERTAEQFPDRDALVFPRLRLRWSWRELNQRVNQIASSLIALGVERGEHVGIWSMNVPEWVVTQLAVARTGCYWSM